MNQPIQLTRKQIRKVERAYIKQAKQDMQEILGKITEWPFRQRVKLALIVLMGKKKNAGGKN